ncbi:MAG: tyrosine-type recombinase/integrase [Vicinamibacterales bacterium]
MSPRTPRRRIATGVYLDRYSLTGKVQVGDRSVEKAFPRDTPSKAIQRWREQERVRLREEAPPTAARGTLDADAEAYLARVAKRPASVPAKRSELKAWCALYGPRRRHQITPADIDAAIAAWLADEVAPKTVVNRCRTLRHLYVTLANDRKARTPLDNVDLPEVARRRPQFVDAATIKAVERKLRAGDAKDRARFMVMAATGIRPSQLMRLTAADVDLRRGLVVVPGGKGGDPIVHVLNADMRAAWQAFAAANAWGSYDTSRLAIVARRAGWPAGVRVYNAKHALGMTLAEQGADPDDIRAWFGHRDQKTTRIYTGVPLARMARLSAQLDGRLGWGAPRSTPRAVDGRRRMVKVSAGNSRARKRAGSKG